MGTYQTHRPSCAAGDGVGAAARRSVRQGTIRAARGRAPSLSEGGRASAHARTETARAEQRTSARTREKEREC
eukprot:6208554-Pleurochrysis_carterae.AAC.1